MVGDIMQNKGNEQNINKDVKEVKSIENDVASVPYIVFESEQVRSERSNKRLLIALVISVVLIFVSNLLWLYAWCQYDYISEATTVAIEGDGDGNANYVGNNTNYIGNDGDINNGKGDGANEVEKENP